MKKTLVLPMLLLLPVCGCVEETDGPPSPFREDKPECVLVFAVDTSVPYRQHLMTDTGLFEFWIGTINNYFRDRIGHDDKMIITQLSNDCDIDLWHGAPGDFTRTIDSPEALRRLIVTDTKPASRPYDALADTISYVLRLPGVSEGRTPAFVVVMSNMMDQTSPNKLIESLKRFRQAGGGIGFYWPDTRALPAVDDFMVKAGYPKPHWKRETHPRALEFKGRD
jgi:hypothetical protein